MGDNAFHWRWLKIAAAIMPLMMFVVDQWNEAIKRNRSHANFYYVGMTDVTAFLLTGAEGHVLIDGGYPESAQVSGESHCPQSR